MPVILPVIVFFKHLLTELSSLCVWILQKDELVGCIRVTFLLPVYPVMVTCTRVSIFHCSLLRTELWEVCSALFIQLLPQCKTRCSTNDDGEGHRQEESLYSFSTSSYFPVLSKYCWDLSHLCPSYLLKSHLSSLTFHLPPSSKFCLF